MDLSRSRDLALRGSRELYYGSPGYDAIHAGHQPPSPGTANDPL